MESAPAFPYDDIVERLTVSHIQTPVERLLGFTADDPAKKAESDLKDNHFDFGPIRRNGELIGRTSVSELNGKSGAIGDSYQPLSEQYLISSGSSIRSAMAWLDHDRWLLVVEGRRITGLVTPSDLNRQAARAYFYLLVADFEIRLADAIRAVFDNQFDVFDLLDDFAIEQTTKNHEKARSGDIDSDLVAAMYLFDMLIVAAKSAEVRSRLDHVLDEDWEWAQAHINDFRKQVMHPATPLLNDTSGLGRLIQIEERLRRLAGDGAVPATKEEVA